MISRNQAACLSIAQQAPRNSTGGTDRYIGDRYIVRTTNRPCIHSTVPVTPVSSETAITYND